MKIIEESLNGVLLLEPVVYQDNRGFFLESYNQSVIDKLGMPFKPIQDNHSLSRRTGTIRGLHFQSQPYVQAKLVQVLAGSIYDVVVDIRSDSPTFGVWRGYHLSADNRRFLFIPKGFAHGFCTLVENTEVFYKVDNPYFVNHSAGILWSDPNLSIDWPLGDKTLSESDKQHPTFDEWIQRGTLST